MGWENCRILVSAGVDKQVREFEKRRSAPKACDVKAWVNAPGDDGIVVKALKARKSTGEQYGTVVCRAFTAWRLPAGYLGRCSRLLHSAPLVLQLEPHPPFSHHVIH